MSLDIEILQASFAKAATIMPHLYAKFHSVLEENFPDTAKKTGHLDFYHHRIAFEAKCKRVLAAHSDPAALGREVRSIVEQPIFKDFTLKDYHCMVSSALFSLGYFFGKDWNDQLASKWTIAFEEIVEILAAEISGRISDIVVCTEQINLDEMAGVPVPSAIYTEAGPVERRSRRRLHNFQHRPKHSSPMQGYSDFRLPDSVVSKIQETANRLVKSAIQSELELALQTEIRKYTEGDINVAVDSAKLTSRIEDYQRKSRHQGNEET
jgi:hypothetical protein